MEQLNAIRERAEKATTGPWFVKSGIAVAEVFVGDKRWLVAEVPHEADAEFIAHARKDVPALIAEVERLQGEVEYWRIEHEHQRKQAELYLGKYKRTKSELEIERENALREALEDAFGEQLDDNAIRYAKQISEVTRDGENQR